MIQIFIIVYGLYALIAGKYNLLPGKKVSGPYARFAGLILVLEPVVAVMIGVAMIRSSPNPQATALDMQSKGFLVDIIMMIAALGISIFIASLAPLQYVEYPEPRRAKNKRKNGSKTGPYTVDEVAELLHMTSDDVLKLILDKKLTARWMDGTYEIDRTVFERYFAWHRQRFTSSFDAPLPPELRDTPAPVAPSQPLPQYTPVASAPRAAAPIDTLPPMSSGASIEEMERIAGFSEAIARNQFDVTAIFNRGRAYYSAGLTSLAVMDFKRVLELQPNHPKAASMRGFIVQYGGTNSAAVNIFSSGEQIRS
jgi:hypothetical protein